MRSAFPRPRRPDAVAGSQSEDNNAVLLGLLAQYPRNKYSLTYSLAEPAIYYHVLESDFGLKGKKLKDRILEELRNIRAFQPALGRGGRDQDGRRQPPLHRPRRRAEPDQFSGKRQRVHGRPDPADPGDRQLGRFADEPRPPATTSSSPRKSRVIIYVGVEFTRLIFMRGGTSTSSPRSSARGTIPQPAEHGVQPSAPRAGQPGDPAHQQDHPCRGEPAGSISRIFWSSSFPTRRSTTSLPRCWIRRPLRAEQQEAISEYAVPIGAAWRILDAGNADLYSVNLLPARVREGQRVFKLAWHGVHAHAPAVPSHAVLHLADRAKSREIKEMKESLDAERKPAGGKPDAVQFHPGAAGAARALQDVAGPVRFPGTGQRAVEQDPHPAQPRRGRSQFDLDLRLRRQERRAITMNGFAVYRTRIPRLSTLFDNSLLRGSQRAGDPGERQCTGIILKCPMPPAGQ